MSRVHSTYLAQTVICILLLLAMGIIVLLGALAYFVLTLVVNRRTPLRPTPATPPRTASPSTTNPPSGRSVR